MAVVLLLFAVAPLASARQYGDTLRILAIGNSFSDDGMEHLPALLEDLGIKNVELARLYRGGCSLDRHLRYYETDADVYRFWHSKAGENKWEREDKYTMDRALKMGEWDIITLQQSSPKSGFYNTYWPYLDSLIAIIREYQPKADLAWHLTWSYSSGSNHAEYFKYDHDMVKMYDFIRGAVRQMLYDEEDTFEYVIPSGIAVQIFRHTELNNAPLDLTRDGYHMDYGMGRYLLAITWYQSLICPYTHKDVRNNRLRLELGNIPVNDETAPIAVGCARKAVKKWKRFLRD